MKEHFDKFKKWLSYDCPPFATTDGWEDYRQDFLKNAPVRYFIHEAVPRAYRHVTNPFVFRFIRMTDWVRYRIVRYHILDSGLEPGYHDKVELMLHANFNMLVDLIEVEKASRHLWSFGDSDVTWWERKTFRRSREFGEMYLAWEISLADPDSGDVNLTQAKAAEEMLYLYTWWKDVRPAREEFGHFSSRDAEFEKEYGIMYHFSDRWRDAYPESYNQWTDECAKSHKRDDFETKQDQAMLHRLISLRLGMWT